MSETLHIGDECTVRVPMRRPLLIAAVLDRPLGDIAISDQCGVVVLQPGHVCEIKAFRDQGRYTLCQTASGLALIATGDLQLLLSTSTPISNP
jgi:hypothetical protein